MMNDNEKRITEATNDRLRARLKTVAALAENALANQPYGIDTCWEHLVGALGRIETEMLIHTAEKPLEKKAIGNFAGEGKVVSYAIDENFAVTVTARTTDGRIWMFKGIKNGETEIMGTIIGGRATAVRCCKFIRNGVVSRLMKIKKNHARRAEKAAAALATTTND